MSNRTRTKSNSGWKSLWTFAMIAGLVSQPALADDISLGEPIYGGNGCPDGTASAVLSPDQKSLSILFDQYLVEAGAAVGKTLDRKSCNIAIPVHVPQGLSISLIQVDYRGYVSAGYGSSATFNVEYFFAGKRGPRATRTFRNHDGEYMINHDLMASALVWSPCGEDVNLRVNSSMMARTSRFGGDVLATVDSADVNAGIVYQIQWRRCNGNGGGFGNPWGIY